uniref:Uncharacterized protein n=1 Tax=Octopus bimaculoides TaxID=37653 RepID=A0A0L8GQ23_OCTBM
MTSALLVCSAGFGFLCSKANLQKTIDIKTESSVLSQHGQDRMSLYATAQQWCCYRLVYVDFNKKYTGHTYIHTYI